MTTIACDGKSMAGDGLITEDDRVCSKDYAKVRHLKDGRVVGFAGNAYNWDEFARWLDDGGDVPKMHEGFGCIVLNRDGSITQYDEHGRSFPDPAPVAIGSGARFALAAMDLGCTPEQAVEAAKKRDVWTGGKVTVLRPSLKLEQAA